MFWNRATRVVSAKSSLKWRHIRSLNSFSQLEASSGMAGYAIGGGRRRGVEEAFDAATHERP